MYVCVCVCVRSCHVCWLEKQPPGPQAGYFRLQCGAIKLLVSFSMLSLLRPQNEAEAKMRQKTGVKFHTTKKWKNRKRKGNKITKQKRREKHRKVFGLPHAMVTQRQQNRKYANSWQEGNSRSARVLSEMECWTLTRSLTCSLQEARRTRHIYQFLYCRLCLGLFWKVMPKTRQSKKCFYIL